MSYESVTRTLSDAIGTQIQHVRWIADRGERPGLRGWFHLGAAQAAIIASTVLITYSWMTLLWYQALGATIYGVGLVALFGVSGVYHRWPWRTAAGVEAWRRADHSMIGVFIAATYTPLCLVVLSPRSAAIMLGVAWVGAIANLVLNLVWVSRPRWLAPVIYVALGWIILPLIPRLWGTVNHAVVWLLFAGGALYTLGALLYGLKWPGRNAKLYGYHEHFHTLTIIAAVLHLIAVWFLVVEAGSAYCA
ncbi:PAQR family membrane homeostasis protein TrhA [Corynebacterium aquatimens]|uniref:Hemolysin III n=1 Tax=Corynebacterium aquatimens TaxID=1190508 RepID=A0A931GVI2_9CORY|nr:hemolysin III family protein [Corynebacterium aquatimens]MBG6121261.1 hemolysin III [Corynebacterium aquatimens]WJY66188.1 hemeolysin-III related [Corynebacterium aquatimens]